jgi:hypothetical protein
MEAPGSPQSTALVRSKMSWTGVIAWAALVTSLLFALLNWRGCWLFRNKPQDLVVFVYPFAWLVLFFAVRAGWRVVLLLGTIPVFLLVANGRWGLSEINSSIVGFMRSSNFLNSRACRRMWKQDR